MSERDEDYASAVYRAIVGAVIGAVLGLFVISEPPFFPGDTVLFGAVVFGFLGYVYGHRFIDIVWNWLSWLP